MNRSWLWSLVSLAVVTNLSACGNGAYVVSHDDQPFGFSEIRRLSIPIATMPPVMPVSAAAALRNDAPQVARLYLDALHRFDGIYGDGIGPAKHAPEYLACKADFYAVGRMIETLPKVTSEAEFVALWRSLKTCQANAARWSGSLEIATFGDDLRAMAEGSMLVLSYATAASGHPPLAQRIYTDAH